MKVKLLKAVIWKESKLFWKSTFGICLFYIIILLYAYIATSKDILESGMLADPKVFVINNIYVMTMLIMIMLGSVILCQSCSIEKKEGTLELVLGTTKNARYIWLGQYFFAIILSYLLSAIGIIVYIVCLRTMFDYPIPFSFLSIILTFLVIPVIASFCLSLYNLVLWITKNQFMQIIYSAFPAFLLLIAFYCLDILQKKSIDSYSAVVITLSCFSIIGIFFNSKMIEKIKSERFF